MSPDGGSAMADWREPTKTRIRPSAAFLPNQHRTVTKGRGGGV